jgi:carboxyl-terminal processing protease
VLEDFKNHLRKSKIEFEPEKFAPAEDEVRRELRREIFSFLWGIENGRKVYVKTDPVVLKAIEVLPEASQLIE